jgi:methyl-accepting chemotaxis protein
VPEHHQGVHRAPAQKLSIPSWLYTILQIPLELKLLGANLMIMLVAVLMLLGPFSLEPTRLTDALIVVTALGVASIVSFVVVRLALRPVKSLTRVGWLVSEGALGARVPSSVVADSELAQLSTTINELLDDLVAERDEVRKLGGELARAERNGDKHFRSVSSILLARAGR